MGVDEDIVSDAALELDMEGLFRVNFKREEDDTSPALPVARDFTAMLLLVVRMPGFSR